MMHANQGTYPNAYPVNVNMGMNMGMGMGMGMMGMNPGMFANMFMYSGNPIGLQTRLQSINQDPQSANIRQATINCTGNQISQLNVMCLVCTIIWGSFLIFPLCFLCCDWWQRMTYPSYSIPVSTYQSLQYLLSLPNIQTLAMTVVDNNLNNQKCQILYDLLSRSQLKGFTFVNGAGHFDLDEKEYSRFQQNMRAIKKLPLISQIKWGTKLAV